MDMRSPNHHGPRISTSGLILLVALVALLVQCFYFWDFTADDAFMTFRYARNLAEGKGPTFNATGLHSEGYTTFLWMAILSFPHMAGFDCVLIAKLLGLSSTVALLAFSALLVSRLAPCPNWHWPTAVAPLLLSSYSGTAVHAISGMETALFALLLTMFVWSATTLLDNPTKRAAAMTCALALFLGLTRPEGNLVALAVLGSLFVLVSRPARTPLFLCILGIYLLPGATYFAWRVWYYRHLFPLPFYVKTSSSSTLPGLSDVVEFVKFTASRLGFFFLIAFLRPHRRFIPGLVSIAFLGVFFVLPVHLMDYQFRYLFPVLPIVCAVASVGVMRLHSWAISPGESRGRGLLVLGATVGTVLVELGSTFPAVRSSRQLYSKGMDQAHIPLGKALAGISKNGGPPTLAIGDAGAVPYYSDWYTIDTFGLNDPEVATSGTHSAAHVLSQAPDVVILISKHADTFEARLSWEEELYAASTQAGFVSIGRLRVNPNYYLWVLVSPNSSVSERLRELPLLR